MKRYYNAEGRCRLRQSNGEDSTTGRSGSSPDLNPTPDLSGPKVCHFCWLPTLVNLQALYLWENQLSGEIPPALGNLGSLRILDLRHNQLSGEIPPELENLSGLETLFLRGNSFTGCIPGSLQTVATNDLDSLGLPYCSS